MDPKLLGTVQLKQDALRLHNKLKESMEDNSGDQLKGLYWSPSLHRYQIVGQK